MARLRVKVVPGSSRDQIVGWLGDALKIKVAAPPEKKGKANEAVIALVAKRHGVAPGAVEIVAGHPAATKELSIARVDDVTLKQAIQ